MSVEQWKRTITLAVVGIILLLLTATVVFGVKYFSLQKDLSRNTVVDLADYSGITEEEGKRLLQYMDGVESAGTLGYQQAYPELYVENDFSFTDTADKVCYLTFDDGPSVTNTPRVLDILKKHGIKATFFVIGQKGEEAEKLYKRIVAEGHTIGIHTYSHDYDAIYKSAESYLDDFQRISNHVEKITGVKPEVFRFPGGSVNGYNEGIYKEIVAEMLRRGYVYYDWNVASRDTVAGITPSEILRNIAYAADESEDDIIVLMHDGEGRESTVEALDKVIKELTRQGFSFGALDKSVSPVCFGYYN